MRAPKVFIKRTTGLLLLLFFLTAAVVSAQTTAFTYQGRLTGGVVAANAAVR